MSSESKSKGSVLVVGAGDALGSAVARRFALDGYNVALTRRTEPDLKKSVDDIQRVAPSVVAKGYASDARKEEAVLKLFEDVERDLGPLQCVVFNVGAWYRESMLTLSVQKFTKIWQMACLGGFLVGRQAARVMVPRGKGTIIFTGATASIRGAAGFAGFASAKHGLRAVAHALAKEVGAKGVHVAHVVVDGGIDTKFVRQLRGPDLASAPPDSLLNPEDIAENYLHLHKQPRNSWTLELDLRPYCETSTAPALLSAL